MGQRAPDSDIQARGDAQIASVLDQFAIKSGNCFAQLCKFGLRRAIVDDDDLFHLGAEGGEIFSDLSLGVEANYDGADATYERFLHRNPSGHEGGTRHLIDAPAAFDNDITPASGQGRSGRIVCEANELHFPISGYIRSTRADGTAAGRPH